MGTIVVVLLLALVLAAAVMLYAAYPYRGEDTPLTPRLGEAMRRGVESLPTLDIEHQDRRHEHQARDDAGRAPPLTVPHPSLIGSLHEQRADLRHPRRRDPRDRRRHRPGRLRQRAQAAAEPRPALLGALGHDHRGAPAGGTRGAAAAGHHARAPGRYGGPAGPAPAAARPAPRAAWAVACCCSCPATASTRTPGRRSRTP